MDTVLDIATGVREFSKIETLYDRDEKTFKVIDGAMRCPEFAAVSRWHVTEKIDGTNIRVALLPGEQRFIGGRTNDAQLPPPLRQFLTETFALDRLRQWVTGDVTEPIVFYGEGYGAKIQKGGGNYRADCSFRLFDIRIGETWIAQEDVTEAAQKMEILRAPILAESATIAEALAFVDRRSEAAFADSGNANHKHEGIVCRSAPLMLNRIGHRIVWKLKVKDFA